MSDPGPRGIDHTPMEVLEKRANDARERGDTYLGTVDNILVQIGAFDQFAADVAHQLRHRIVYRSDGGRFARALVRASGDLQKIHTALLAMDTPFQGKVRLTAILFRRVDPHAVDRWVMGIRFFAPDFIDITEPVVVKASRTRVASAKCVQLERLLPWMHLVAKEIPGKRGKRIRGMIELADRLDCPKGLELWYYSRTLTLAYTTPPMWMGPKGRARMTEATGRKLPFDGEGWDGARRDQWRHYPFKWIVEHHAFQKPADASRMKIELLVYENEINATFVELNKRSAQTKPASSLGPRGDREYLSNEVADFIKHLGALTKDPNHLYS
ncbi:hypothetical protein AB4Z51_44850, partial [Bradyrhizobium sp. 2TAF36]